MDVDLQDPPSLLPKMYAMLQSGTCDCVAARRSSREGEGKIKSFLSNAFYGVINRLSRTEIVSGARDYRLMSRKMVDAVLEMSEYNRFSDGSVFTQNGWNLSTRTAAPGRRSGRFESSSRTRSTASQAFP